MDRGLSIHMMEAEQLTDLAHARPPGKLVPEHRRRATHSVLARALQPTPEVVEVRAGLLVRKHPHGESRHRRLGPASLGVTHLGLPLLLPTMPQLLEAPCQLLLLVP